LKISGYAQEMMCFVGQNLVFEQASSLINNLTGAEFNAKQIERTCHLYGGLLEEETQLLIESGASKEYSNQIANELHYAMIDGAMYPTKEEKYSWKEVKLGRVIRSQEILSLSEKRNYIETSTYVGHLGEAKDFFPKMEYVLDGLKNLVFVCDGAKWIWNWVDLNYPESIQILDFYHAKEHLCEFAKDYFSDEKTRKQWIDNQSDALLKQTPEIVIQAIKDLEYQEKSTVKRENLLNYYQTNRNRIRYKEFKAQGLYIGSGAIESAHKTFQERLKLSGQHWTEGGLQKMTQLRVAYKSNDWERVKRIARIAA
jgi:Uncharacterised protein family (UPF0236)